MYVRYPLSGIEVLAEKGRFALLGDVIVRVAATAMPRGLRRRSGLNSDSAPRRATGIEGDLARFDRRRLRRGSVCVKNSPRPPDFDRLRTAMQDVEPEHVVRCGSATA